MAQSLTQDRTVVAATKELARFLGLAAVASLLGWVFAGVVHEFGHTLTARVFHGFIADASLATPAGDPLAAYAGAQKSLESIAGIGMVYLAGMLFLLLCPFQREGARARLILTFGVFPFVIQMLSSVLLPLLQARGQPIDSDVTQFINHSGLHPHTVSLAAGVLLIAGLWLLTKRSRLISTVQLVAG